MAEEFEDDVGFPSEEINAIVQKTCEEILETVNWDEK